MVRARETQPFHQPARPRPAYGLAARSPPCRARTLGPQSARDAERVTGDSAPLFDARPWPATQSNPGGCASCQGAKPLRSAPVLCRPWNRPVPRRREIKAVVRSGAHRRSLLGDCDSALEFAGSSISGKHGKIMRRRRSATYGGRGPRPRTVALPAEVTVSSQRARTLPELVIRHFRSRRRSRQQSIWSPRTQTSGMGVELWVELALRPGFSPQVRIATDGAICATRRGAWVSGFDCGA